MRHRRLNSGATMSTALEAGTRAESRVFAALAALPAPWRAFPTVEWRLLVPQGGEQVGEADGVVFHPHHGLIVLEVKAGAVAVRDGQSFYGAGAAMKQSPFAQARRNRYALAELLAPDRGCLVPLAVRVDDALGAMHQATDQQVRALRLLRGQPRLLVEGGAGTGKTLLAAALAREHAALGRAVLFTCFNKALAEALATALADVPGITVLAFHELARQLATQAGLAYAVPADPAAQGVFFREASAELLLQAAEQGGPRFDTLVVDEAADFFPTWWVALEALGAPGFSWYCFYDRSQCLFQSGDGWEPPFQAVPFALETNLRNTRPIGELAARLGGCALPHGFRVDEGPAPVLVRSADFAAMAAQLRRTLRDLLGPEAFRPEQVAVLSPYRHTNPGSAWAAGLDGVQVACSLPAPEPGRVRVGTIQGFKGLESDVVILAGIDSRSLRHPATLYVGASRARALLLLLALDDVVLPVAG